MEILRWQDAACVPVQILVPVPAAAAATTATPVVPTIITPVAAATAAAVTAAGTHPLNRVQFCSFNALVVLAAESANVGAQSCCRPVS